MIDLSTFHFQSLLQNKENKMKKFLIFFLAITAMGIPTSQAKTSIVGGPFTNLDSGVSVIHLNLSNYPKDKGIYIFQVVRNRTSENARPTVINMDNAVDVVTSANHADVQFVPVSKFGATDCSVVECALWAQFDGASGSYQLTDEDQYISSLSFNLSTVATNPADTIEASVVGMSLSTTNPGTLAYRTPVTISVKTGSGAFATIKSSTGDCSVNGFVVQALKGSGGCDFEITSMGNSTTSKKVMHFPFMLAPATQIATQKITSLKVGKLVALAKKTNFGESIGYTSTSKKICTVKGANIIGVNAGICTLTLSSVGTSNYPALNSTISLPVVKK